MTELTPIHSALVQEVIVITVNKGAGTDADPVRIVTQFWSLQGELLAEADTHMSGATYSMQVEVKP